MDKIKTLFSVAVIALLCNGALADVCEDGVQAVKKQNYKIALEKFTSSTKRNEKKCLMGMSYLNYFGYGIPQNYEQAFIYAQSSAQLGFAEAQGFLSAMYAEGQGTSKNLIKAHMWSNVASAQGVTFAQQVRDSVSQKMGVDEIKAAQSLAKACEEKKYQQCE